MIPGTAQRSEAKEEKRDKDCRYRHRAYGRGLRDSIRNKNVARGFDPMGTVPIEVKRETYAKLAEYVRQGKFKLQTEVYPLADFPRAWERQKKSPNGKIIIDLKR